MTVDPTMGGQQAAIGNFLAMLGVTLILATDLHHVALANREPARTQLLDHRGIGLDAPGLDASLAQQLEKLASTAAEVGNRPRRRADEVLHVGGLG